MSHDETIHDLLERAVRDHTPTILDPERAVLDRVRRHRRRAAVLTLAATLVVVLGGAGALDVLSGRARGDGPAAGPTDRSANRSAGQPDDAVGREQAAAAAAAAEAAASLADAEHAAGRGEFSVTTLDLRLAAIPEGWTDFPAPGTAGSPEDVICSPVPRTVYATLVLVGSSGESQPCLGAPVAPYIWDGGGLPPRLDEPVIQEVLSDGTPRWVQTGSDSDGESVTTVYFPTTGQSVRAAGIPVDNLVSHLSPHWASLGGPLAPAPSVELSAEVSLGGGPVITARSDDLADLVTQLRHLRTLDALTLEACDRIGGHGDIGPQWQIQLWRGQLRDGFIVVDPPTVSCAAAAAYAGGVRQPTEELIATLEQIMSR